MYVDSERGQDHYELNRWEFERLCLFQFQLVFRRNCLIQWAQCIPS